MREYRFRLAIPAQEYLAYYQGAVKQVVVTLTSGQTVQFPAEFLRPFVSHGGVHGNFILRVNEQNKLHSLDRVEG